MLFIAVEMGYDLQSKKFWRTTPANLLRQYQGFKVRQQTEMLPIRHLMQMFAASKGVTLAAHKLFPLSYIDEPEEVVKAEKLTPERIAKLEANHKLIKAKFLERKAYKDKNKKQINKLWQQKF